MGQPNYELHIELGPLIELQEDLDHAIYKKRQIENIELSIYKFCAFAVELGEMMNEWKRFKYWKKSYDVDNEKLLEEYVDALHFMASIFAYYKEQMPDLLKESYVYPEPSDPELQDQHEVMDLYLDLCGHVHYFRDMNQSNFIIAMKDLLELGAVFGFSWNQVFNAYLRKRRKNFKRLNKKDKD